MSTQERLDAVHERMINIVNNRFVKISKRFANVMDGYYKHMSTLSCHDLTAIENFVSIAESATGTIEHVCSGLEDRLSAEGWIKYNEEIYTKGS